MPKITELNFFFNASGVEINLGSTRLERRTHLFVMGKVDLVWFYKLYVHVNWYFHFWLTYSGHDMYRLWTCRSNTKKSLSCFTSFALSTNPEMGFSKHLQSGTSRNSENTVWLKRPFRIAVPTFCSKPSFRIVVKIAVPTSLSRTASRNAFRTGWRWFKETVTLIYKGGPPGELIAGSSDRI